MGRGLLLDAQLRIRTAIIRIAVENGLDYALDSIAHEFVHVMGMHGHGGSRFDSILTGPPVLTTNDLILIRTLYDPRIRAGMSRDNAMVIVPELIAELLAALEAAEDPVQALAQR